MPDGSFMKTTGEPTMFNFNAKYLPILDIFAADHDEPREYLQGYHIMPHPDKGVLLKATDGHIACVVHDESGECDGQYIIARDKRLAAHAQDEFFGMRCAWTRGGRITISSDLESEVYIQPYNDNAVTCGKPYPSFDRLIPEKITSIEEIPPLDARLGSRVMSAAYMLCDGESQIRMHSTGRDTSAVVQLVSHPHVAFFIMPMRPDNNDPFDGSRFITGGK